MPLAHSIDASTQRDLDRTAVPVVALVSVGVPVLAAFTALLLFVAAEMAGARPFSVAPAANIAEAAAFGDAARILAFIDEQQDPNARWEVRAGTFDARRPLHVTAIEAAILARKPEEAVLLLHHGARPGANGGTLACLAQAVDLGRELPPATFGAENKTYYDGALIEGTRALSQCGLPAD